jgi:prepilin-type N-terminal cleavage/methylation domain-containing protein
MKYLRQTNRKAFSLLEIIITIVVLGLLASIAFVGYGAVVTRAATSSTEASLMHIDSAVDVTHAMRTAIDGGPRADADFATAAYGTDGIGDSEISSSTGTWDLVKADVSHSAFDDSTVYYVLSNGVTGMAKTVIDSSPDGDRYHLSFLKSSFAQTVTWSAWCEITPADLTNMDPGSSNWPHPDCRFEGTFQNNPGNASPAEITDAGTVSPAQDGAYVSPIQFDGYAEDVVYTFTPVSDDRPSATPAAGTVVSPNYSVQPAAVPVTVSGLIPGVNYTVEAALYFNDPVYGPGLEDSATLVDVDGAPQTVRPYTVPAAPSVAAELTKSQLDGDGNVTPDFDATVTVSWADDYTGSAANTGFTPTDAMNFRVEQSRDGGSSFSVVASTLTPDNEIALNAGTYSVVVDAVAGSEMTFRVVAINDSGLEAETWVAPIPVGNVPVQPEPAIQVNNNTLANPSFDYEFVWAVTPWTDSDPSTTVVNTIEGNLNSTGWETLTGTSGTINGNGSANQTVSYEARINTISTNEYGVGEAKATDSKEFVFGAPVVVDPDAVVVSITAHEEQDLTPRVKFDWSATGSPTEWDVTSGWSDDTWKNATHGQSYTVTVKARRCEPGNDYNSTAEVCSNWSEATATVNVGSPVAKPNKPVVSITPHEQKDLTPRVKFDWSATNSPNQWDVTSGWTDNTWKSVSHGQSYSVTVKAQRCVPGNNYNRTSPSGAAPQQCSGWGENTKTVNVGSPVDPPNKPVVSITPHEQKDLTPRVKFDWSATNSPNQWDVTSGWTDNTWKSVSHGQSYSVTVKAQRCVPGNNYNRTSPSGAAPQQCSGWGENTKTVNVGSPVAKPNKPVVSMGSQLDESVPRVKFNWSATGSPTQWDVTSGWSNNVWKNVNHGSSPTVVASARRCVSGNYYNRTSPSGAAPQQCSDWDTESRTIDVGSPPPPTSTPTTPSVTIDRRSALERVHIDWKGGDLQASLDNGNSWFDLSDTDQYYNITPTSSSSIRVRAINYGSCNSYGCSSDKIATSLKLDTWMYPEVRAVHHQGIEEPCYNTIQDGRLRIDSYSRGYSGTYWHTFKYGSGKYAPSASFSGDKRRFSSSWVSATNYYGGWQVAVRLSSDVDDTSGSYVSSSSLSAVKGKNCHSNFSYGMTYTTNL